MFVLGQLAVAFTELQLIRGSSPPCFGCMKPLGKQLSIPHFHTRNLSEKDGSFSDKNSIVSFWSIRCPDCSQSHIIFNSPNILPPPPELPTPIAEDPRQQKLATD
jgi:hypothetical protein